MENDTRVLSIFTAAIPQGVFAHICAKIRGGRVLKKHMLSVLFISIVFLFFCKEGVSYAAKQDDPIMQWQGTYSPTMQMPDNQELLDGYISELFFPSFYQYQSSRKSAAYGLEGDSRLDKKEKKLYSILLRNIKKIASGKRESTVITISDYSLISHLTQEKFEILVNYLLVDCPYELYWFDKVKGVSISRGWRPQIRFAVASDYRDSSLYKVRTEDVKRAEKARRNADKIIKKNASKSDYQKLAAYRDAICRLTSYNISAAKQADASMGIDPWQIVFVFDGDESTKVVCEGYSKAFQYLCDNTAFMGKIKCRIVTGKFTSSISGYSVSGPHMWNVVRMDDGRNYLVDVTNIDGQSQGIKDMLFLTGRTAESDGGYTFQTLGGVGFHYVYDQETKSVYQNSKLTLSTLQNYQKTSLVTTKYNTSAVLSTIHLMTSSIGLKTGKSYMISLKTTKYRSHIKRITYTSSNKRIATVGEGGKIKKLKKGTAVIKVKVTLINGKSKSMKLKVTND